MLLWLAFDPCGVLVIPFIPRMSNYDAELAGGKIIEL